jgi:hypothetical protein
MLLATPPAVSWRERLQVVLLGYRHHLWMYDAASLGRLLRAGGFVNVVALAPGVTTIRDPGALDLAERVEESVYLEARKPGGSSSDSSTALRDRKVVRDRLNR